MTLRRHLGPNKELEAPSDVIVKDMERLKEEVAKMKLRSQGALTKPKSYDELLEISVDYAQTEEEEIAQGGLLVHRRLGFLKLQPWLTREEKEDEPELGRVAPGFGLGCSRPDPYIKSAAFRSPLGYI
ncbi:hypothetical protein QYF36_001189 [Acer negundo]|nr:hypothetical protein QYF36_001189 [Acer negundo]